MYVQADIRALVNMGEEMEMTKEGARKLKLTYATYVKQENMVISEDFWNLNIEHKPVKRDGVAKLNAHRINKSPKDDERELILKN